MIQLELHFANNSANDELKKTYENCKTKLEDLYDFIAQGAILRSKCSWYEKGEKSTKFFLNLEKQRKNKTHVKKILDNNTEISDQAKILKSLKLFTVIFIQVSLW